MTAIRDLEGVVELVFDYVSPVDLALRPIPADRIAESLVSQISERSKGQVLLGDCPAVSVSADSRRLRRCFQLLGQACEHDWTVADRISVRVTHEPADERVEFQISYETTSGHGGSTSESLLWAVAGRLLELHGGALLRTPSTENACLIVLPAARDDDAGV
jgi:hypothetical protein